MKIRLVVADDAPFIREVVKNLLAGSAVEIVGEAENGEHTLEVVRALRPDVLLLDLVMPQKSGLEVATILKRELPGLKILAFSTLDQSRAGLEALDAGCSHYLVKPFSRDELLRSITQLMDKDRRG